MREHDAIWDDAKPESPFSNGTSGEIWMSNWCWHPCKKDRNEDCPLILVAYMGRTPKEWTETGLQDYNCSEFEPDDPAGEGETPEPDPAPTVPGQVDMFEVFADSITTEIAKELQPV